MSVSFSSSGIIVSNKLVEMINGLENSQVAELSVDGVYDISFIDDLKVWVSPLTTVLDRDAKKIIRERIATQITFVKKTNRSNEDVDALIKKIENLQQFLFFSEIGADNKRWIIEQIELVGNIKTASGERFDGLFDGDDLGDAGIFKANLIVASSRFLMLQ